MSNMMQHKGYVGSVEYSAEDKTFFGKLDGIRDLVSFEGSDVDSLETSFKEAVDDYLELCKSENRQPEKPFKGQFQVRTKPEIHRGLALAAAKRKTNLNAIAEAAFEAFLALTLQETQGGSKQPQKRNSA
ncbi:MAG: type II toxin-antitoxin system HicB family antitoxin [Candidatus Moraniibacteriota bacterium]|nr:MAG: type II toxin-antitoxin system HicB family antitoxin [Candidatus Moranbacteria bacterium]